MFMVQDIPGGPHLDFTHSFSHTTLMCDIGRTRRVSPQRQQATHCSTHFIPSRTHYRYIT